MGADPVDLLGSDAGVGQGLRRCPSRLAPICPRLDHVERIRGRGVAHHFGIRLGPARSRGVLRLEHEERRALAHDEPVASRVEWPTRVLRFVVPTV